MHPIHSNSIYLSDYFKSLIVSKACILILCITSLSLTALHSCFCQTIQKNVINAGGTTITKNGVGAIVFNLGEPAIAEYQIEDLSLAEGFLGFPIKLVTGISEFSNENLQLSYFPNPTSDQLIIKRSISDQNLEIKLYDLNGRLGNMWNMASGESSISIGLNQYASGTYILQIFDKRGELIKSGKIILIQ